MPLYDYECDKGHVVEISHRLVDQPEIICTKCITVMKKVLAAPQVSFRGSGFYSTDK